MCIYHVRFVFTLTINVHLPYLFRFYFDYQCVFTLFVLFLLLLSMCFYPICFVFTLIINVYSPCLFCFYVDYQCVFTMFVLFLL